MMSSSIHFKSRHTPFDPFLPRTNSTEAYTLVSQNHLPLLSRWLLMNNPLYFTSACTRYHLMGQSGL